METPVLLPKAEERVGTRYAAAVSVLTFRTTNVRTDAEQLTTKGRAVPNGARHTARQVSINLHQISQKTESLPVYVYAH